MGQLAARSFMVLALLFGLLFAVGAVAFNHYNFPVTYAVGLAVVIVIFEYLLGPFIIDWVFKIRWTNPNEISPQFASFLADLCKRRGIKVPRFGIIEDGNPNAFTYGHVPSNARLVVTRGVQQMLSEDEFNAVVAHEVGHITHYDFIVMTLASVVPLVLYLIWRWTRGSRRGEAAIVGLSAYVAYVASRYIVLFLSRVREYFADEHSAYSVDSANSISRALIKIAYGLARIPQQDLDQQANQQPARSFRLSKQPQKQSPLQPSQLMGSLGFCSFSSATPMALYSTTATGQFSHDKMLKAMQWDLWNPWARIFELQSTHPLIARRVLAASEIAMRRGEAPQFEVSKPPKESYWSEFTMDLIFAGLPYVGLLMGIAGSGLMAVQNKPLGIFGGIGLGFVLFSIGWMLRLAYSYTNEFKKAKIEDLVGEVAVSHVRCIPVEIEGQVIGRGVPGLFWSKDLVIQDDTGFITLIYRQPLGFLETLFGLFRAGDLVGKKGVFRGWYRRGPAPFLELSSARFEDRTSVKCSYYVWAWVFAVLGMLIGLGIMMFPHMG